MVKRTKFALLLFIFLFGSLCIFMISGYETAKKPTSFLPQIPSNIEKNIILSSNKLRIVNENYSLIIDSLGKVNVRSAHGQTIVSSISYFSALENERENWGLKKILVSKLNDSTLNIHGNGPNHSVVNVSFITHRFLPEINVKINTFYKYKSIVDHEALVIGFNVPLSKVYLKNRKIDSTNFESEYWLQQEGVRFGANESSALIYHTPNVSSLQLKTDSRLLFVNLDFYKDHPYVKMLDEKGSEDKWIDLSKSKYLRGSERNNSFTISLGNICPVIPRLMLVPDGYKAGYVFTEHADGGNIKKQRAAYFGSEDITHAQNATGGFVGNKIPVTKSVFYSGPLDSSGEAIIEKNHNTLLLDFLDQLYKTGMYDLCLHTPENYNSNSQTLKEAIRFMKQRYNTVSWIDHGFYNGGNKEASVAEGFDSTSKYFAACYWEKNQTHYFWSPSVELINEKNKVSVTDEFFKLNFYKAYVTLWRHFLSTKDLKTLSFFKAANLLWERKTNKFELNNLQSNLDNSLPTPLYWQHPTRTKLVYLWSTYTVNHYSDLSNDKVIQNEKQINNLIQNRGVFIDHEYCVRDVGPNNVITKKDGKLIINPYFNKYLKILAQKRDEGELDVTTIKDLMDYWISLKSVSFEYSSNNQIKIFNQNNIPVKGLSLVVNANNILIDGQIPSIKRLNNELIFWFDMPPNSEKTIILK
jgi:hypothetical protein